MKPFKMFAFIFVLTMAVSCGGAKNDTANSATNAIMANSGTALVTGANAFVGNWAGYVDEDLTTMTIKADGSVLIFANGSSLNEKLVKNAAGEYFITDTKNNQVLKIQASSWSLSLFDPDGYGYSFTRN